MPFRESDEAARARIDALEEQVAELKTERDELIAAKTERENAEKTAAKSKKKKSVEEPAPAPIAKPDPGESRSTSFAGAHGVKIVAFALIAATCTFFVARSDRAKQRLVDDYNAKLAARDAMTKQWAALVSVEPCVRSTEISARYVRDVAVREKDAHRSIAFINSTLESLTANCTDGAKAFVSMPTTPVPVKAPLSRWLAAEPAITDPAKKLAKYYDARDYQEDNFKSAPAMWTDLLARIDQREALFADVRASALPVFRAQIRERQSAEEAIAGKSETWWRIEIGLSLWEAYELGFRAVDLSSDKTPDFAAADRAMQPAFKAIVDRAKDAPIEVRRYLRKYDFTVPTTSLEAMSSMTGSIDPLSDLRDKPPALPVLPPKPSRYDD